MHRVVGVALEKPIRTPSLVPKIKTTSYAPHGKDQKPKIMRLIAGHTPQWLLRFRFPTKSGQEKGDNNQFLNCTLTQKEKEGKMITKEAQRLQPDSYQETGGNRGKFRNREEEYLRKNI